jgi:hypothetical protein
MAEPQLKVSAFSQILSMLNGKTSAESFYFYIYNNIDLIQQ